MEEGPKGDLDFYTRIAKPLVLNLPRPEGGDRILAAGWIKKFRDENAGDEKLRTNYLKLLLFCVQRRRLVGMFADDPAKCVVLEELPPEFNLNDLAKYLIEQEQSEKRDKIRRHLIGDVEVRPPYFTDCSTDLTEYVAAQDIPDFGVHAYYAVSDEPATKWYRFEKTVLPRGVKSTVDACLADVADLGASASEPLCACSSKAGEAELEQDCRRREKSPSPERRKAVPKRFGQYPPTAPIGVVGWEEERVAPTWGTNLVEVREPVGEDATEVDELEVTEDVPEEVDELDVSVKADDMSRMIDEWKEGTIVKKRRKIPTRSTGMPKRPSATPPGPRPPTPIAESTKLLHPDATISEEPEEEGSIYEQGVLEAQSVVDRYAELAEATITKQKLAEAGVRHRATSPALRGIPVTTPRSPPSPRRSSLSQKLYAEDDDDVQTPKSSLKIRTPQKKQPERDETYGQPEAKIPEMSQLFEQAQGAVEEREHSMLAEEAEFLQLERDVGQEEDVVEDRDHSVAFFDTSPEVSAKAATIRERAEAQRMLLLRDSSPAAREILEKAQEDLGEVDRYLPEDTPSTLSPQYPAEDYYPAEGEAGEHRTMLGDETPPDDLDDSWREFERQFADVGDVWETTPTCSPFCGAASPDPLSESAEFELWEQLMAEESPTYQPAERRPRPSPPTGPTPAELAAAELERRLLRSPATPRTPPYQLPAYRPSDWLTPTVTPPRQLPAARPQDFVTPIFAEEPPPEFFDADVSLSPPRTPRPSPFRSPKTPPPYFTLPAEREEEQYWQQWTEGLEELDPLEAEMIDLVPEMHPEELYYPKEAYDVETPERLPTREEIERWEVPPSFREPVRRDHSRLLDWETGGHILYRHSGQIVDEMPDVDEREEEYADFPGIDFSSHLPLYFKPPPERRRREWQEEEYLLPQMTSPYVKRARVAPPPPPPPPPPADMLEQELYDPDSPQPQYMLTADYLRELEKQKRERFKIKPPPVSPKREEPRSFDEIWAKVVRDRPRRAAEADKAFMALAQQEVGLDETPPEEFFEVETDEERQALLDYSLELMGARPPSGKPPPRMPLYARMSPPSTGATPERPSPPVPRTPPPRERPEAAPCGTCEPCGPPPAEPPRRRMEKKPSKLRETKSSKLRRMQLEKEVRMSPTSRMLTARRAKEEEARAKKRAAEEGRRRAVAQPPPARTLRLPRPPLTRPPDYRPALGDGLAPDTSATKPVYRHDLDRDKLKGTRVFERPPLSRLRPPTMIRPPSGIPTGVPRAVAPRGIPPPAQVRPPGPPSRLRPPTARPLQATSGLRPPAARPPQAPSGLRPPTVRPPQAPSGLRPPTARPLPAPSRLRPPTIRPPQAPSGLRPPTTFRHPAHIEPPARRTKPLDLYFPEGAADVSYGPPLREIREHRVPAWFKDPKRPKMAPIIIGQDKSGRVKYRLQRRSRPPRLGDVEELEEPPSTPPTQYPVQRPFDYVSPVAGPCAPCSPEYDPEVLMELGLTEEDLKVFDRQWLDELDEEEDLDVGEFGVDEDLAKLERSFELMEKEEAEFEAKLKALEDEYAEDIAAYGDATPVRTEPSPRGSPHWTPVGVAGPSRRYSPLYTPADKMGPPKRVFVDTSLSPPPTPHRTPKYAPAKRIPKRAKQPEAMPPPDLTGHQRRMLDQLEQINRRLEAVGAASPDRARPRAASPTRSPPMTYDADHMADIERRVMERERQEQEEYERLIAQERAQAEATPQMTPYFEDISRQAPPWAESDLGSCGGPCGGDLSPEFLKLAQTGADLDQYELPLYDSPRWDEEKKRAIPLRTLRAPTSYKERLAPKVLPRATGPRPITGPSGAERLTQKRTARSQTPQTPSQLRIQTSSSHINRTLSSNTRIGASRTELTIQAGVGGQTASQRQAPDRVVRKTSSKKRMITRGHR